MHSSSFPLRFHVQLYFFMLCKADAQSTLLLVYVIMSHVWQVVSDLVLLFLSYSVLSWIATRRWMYVDVYECFFLLVYISYMAVWAFVLPFLPYNHPLMICGFL